MNRYFLKVNGEVHCPRGICRPDKSEEWEGGEILLPLGGPVHARSGKRQDAQPIQEGDELWIWTHEDKNHGNGWGLTAKAIAGQQSERDGHLAVALVNVKRLARPFGLKNILKGDRNKNTSSRLLDHIDSHRDFEAYLIEDEAFGDFIKIVGQHSALLPDDVRFKSETEWDRKIRNHKETLLESLINRRLALQKPRLGQQAFRDALFIRHNGRCVLSCCNVPETLEAAHVMPHTGDPIWDQPENGLLLRRDFHALFDAMLWSINPATDRVQVAARLKSTNYGKLHGQEVDHKVAPELLKMHFIQFGKASSDE